MTVTRPRQGALRYTRRMPANFPRDLLLVAYEFPPSAGAAVQRIAKYARFLPEAGWRARVICAEPIPGWPTDETLVEEVADVEVTRLPGRNTAVAIAQAIAPVKRLLRPGGAPASGSDAAAVRSGTGAVAPASSSPDVTGARRPLSTRLSRWIAVPDDAVRWSREVVETALHLHAERPFAAVLASGPPYSALVAATQVSERLGIPFVADLRDAWRDNRNIEWPTAAHRRRSDALEREVMAHASAVVAVSDPIATEAREMGAPRTLVVPNGFDSTSSPRWSPDPVGPFKVVFLGRMSAKFADPRAFLEGFAIATQRFPEFADATFEVLGPDVPFVCELVTQLGLAERVRFRGFLPYAEALAEVARADAGLICFWDAPGSEAIYSTKLFDYLGVGLPILLMGPTDGVAARLIREAGVGEAVGYSDSEGAARALGRLVQAKAAGTSPIDPVAEVVARYDRRSQVLQVGRLLDEVIHAG